MGFYRGRSVLSRCIHGYDKWVLLLEIVVRVNLFLWHENLFSLMKLSKHKK